MPRGRVTSRGCTHTHTQTQGCGNWLENIAATHSKQPGNLPRSPPLPLLRLLQLFKSFRNMLQCALLCCCCCGKSFAAEKCAYLVFSTSYLLPVECTQISCTPSSPPSLHFIRQAAVRGGRGRGKGHRGWSAAKVYPFFCALISIIDDATVHSIGKGKTTSTAALATLAATAAAAARHKIKPKAIYVVALARWGNIFAHILWHICVLSASGEKSYHHQCWSWSWNTAASVSSRNSL